MFWFSQVVTDFDDKEEAYPWVGFWFIWGSRKNRKWLSQAFWAVGHGSLTFRVQQYLCHDDSHSEKAAGICPVPHPAVPMPACFLLYLLCALSHLLTCYLSLFLFLSHGFCLLMSLFVALSFCPLDCLCLCWLTEPSFPRSFPVLAVTFLHPENTRSPEHTGTVGHPHLHPFPIHLICEFSKKEEGRPD